MNNKEAIERLILIFERCCNRIDAEALDLAIEALKEKPKGGWVRKENVIHSIAKQYSEHNELVPIWLSIGDIKSGADMRKEKEE